MAKEMDETSQRDFTFRGERKSVMAWIEKMAALGTRRAVGKRSKG